MQYFFFKKTCQSILDYLFLKGCSNNFRIFSHMQDKKKENIFIFIFFPYLLGFAWQKLIFS
jgi:hypothetical protein